MVGGDVSADAGVRLSASRAITTTIAQRDRHVRGPQVRLHAARTSVEQNYVALSRPRRSSASATTSSWARCAACRCAWARCARAASRSSSSARASPPCCRRRCGAGRLAAGGSASAAAAAAAAQDSPREQTAEWFGADRRLLAAARRVRHGQPQQHRRLFAGPARACAVSSSAWTTYRSGRRRALRPTGARCR